MDQFTNSCRQTFLEFSQVSEVIHVFPYGRPVCLWTAVILGKAILAFLTWTTLMDELELVQFLVHHQLPPCTRVVQSTIKFVVVLSCPYVSY